MAISSIAYSACITKPQAQTLAWRALENTLCDVEAFENEAVYEQCAHAQNQVKNKMRFESNQLGWTVLIREFECAQGATCWEWFSISCQGKLTFNRNGEN